MRGARGRAGAYGYDTQVGGRLVEYQTAINFRHNQLDSRGRDVEFSARIMCAGWLDGISIDGWMDGWMADELRLMHWKI